MAAVGNGKSVLALEDGPEASALKSMLESMGYEADVVPMMSSFATKFHRNPHQPVILDVYVNDGSGPAAAEIARAVNPYAPIVLMSGISSDKNQIEERCGHYPRKVAFAEKPYSPEKVAKALREAEQLVLDDQEDDGMDEKDEETDQDADELRHLLDQCLNELQARSPFIELRKVSGVFVLGCVGAWLIWRLSGYVILSPLWAIIGAVVGTLFFLGSFALEYDQNRFLGKLERYLETEGVQGS